MEQNKPNVNNSIFDNHFNLERLKSFFEYTESDELILLKGHLLIEEIIDWRLTQKIKIVDYKDLNLNFYKKVILFSSLCGMPRNDELIKNIFEINKIRNIYAHNLNANIKEEFIKYFLNTYRDDTPKTIKKKSTYLNTLRKFLYFILGQLYGQGLIVEYDNYYKKT